ncbi:TPA: hypothetical protein ACUNF5_002776 [Burkholderia orbicola]
MRLLKALLAVVASIGLDQWVFAPAMNAFFVSSDTVVHLLVRSVLLVVAAAIVAAQVCIVASRLIDSTFERLAARRASNGRGK